MSEPSMVEKVARAIDESAFRQFESMRDYCLRNGDSPDEANKCAQWAHGAQIDRAMLNARAAIEAIPDEDEAFLAALSRRAHDARFGRSGETYPVLRNFIRALKDAALQEGKEGK